MSSAAENLERVEHLVVLMMENRSFDQMLGYLMKDGLPGVNGLTGEEWNADEQGNRVEVRPCDLSEPLEKRYDPCHGTGCVAEQLEDGNRGFVRNFIASRKKEDGPLPQEYRDLVMRYYTGEFLPAYDALARAFCVCDAWHSSVPGDTWPNRLYAMAGRHGRRSPPPLFERLRAWLPILRRKLESIPIYELEAFTRHLAPRQWRWYSHDPATLRLCDKRYRDFSRRGLEFRGLQRENFAYFDRRRVSFLTEFLEGKLVARDSFLDDVARGQLRDVSWIDPNFVDVRVLDPDSNDDHPPTSVLAGQALVLEIYEALYRSEAWPNTVLVVVYDEHGGFYDHVEPPAVVDDPEFKTLGVRVPALVIGPRVQNTVCHTLFDHTTLIKTILNRFVSEEGGRRARALATMSFRVQAAPDLSEVLADAPRDDLPEPREMRPRIDENLALMRDARRAANSASRAPDGVGQLQELHDFQQEFLRFALAMRKRGLPPGQP